MDTDSSAVFGCLWQVLEVVRSNYDTLTLKLQDGLDQYERYSEQHKEAAFFKELVSCLDSAESTTLFQSLCLQPWAVAFGVWLSSPVTPLGCLQKWGRNRIRTDAARLNASESSMPYNMWLGRNHQSAQAGNRSVSLCPFCHGDPLCFVVVDL